MTCSSCRSWNTVRSMDLIGEWTYLIINGEHVSRLPFQSPLTPSTNGDKILPSKFAKSSHHFR